MKPNVIKARLVLKGITQQSIAQSCGCTRQTINLVIHNRCKSHRVADAIARAIGFPPSRVFPWYRAAS